MNAGGIQKWIRSPLTDMEILMSNSRKLSTSLLGPQLPGWLNEERAAMDIHRSSLLQIEGKSNSACPRSVYRKAVVSELGRMHGWGEWSGTTEVHFNYTHTQMWAGGADLHRHVSTACTASGAELEHHVARFTNAQCGKKVEAWMHLRTLMMGLDGHASH